MSDKMQGVFTPDPPCKWCGKVEDMHFPDKRCVVMRDGKLVPSQPTTPPAPAAKCPFHGQEGTCSCGYSTDDAQEGQTPPATSPVCKHCGRGISKHHGFFSTCDAGGFVQFAPSPVAGEGAAQVNEPPARHEPKCCGDAHFEVEAMRSHFDALGIVITEKRENGIIERLFSNARAEKAEAALAEAQAETKRLNEQIAKLEARARTASGLAQLAIGALSDQPPATKEGE